LIDLLIEIKQSVKLHG